MIESVIECVEDDVNRILKLLREKIRAMGYNQSHVQNALGWGGSYISQLLTRHKRLRFDQVLLILDFIGVAPEVFIIEAFHIDPKRHRVDSDARRIGDLLVAKGLVSRDELTGALNPARQRRPRRRPPVEKAPDETVEEEENGRAKKAQRL